MSSEEDGVKVSERVERMWAVRLRVYLDGRGRGRMLAVVVFVGGKVEEEVAGGRGGVEGIADAGDGDGGEDIAGGCDKGYRC